MTQSDKKPAISVQASTVILIRQKGSDLQVYLVKRSPLSSFMPGNYVFPGGMLDPDDRDFGFWKSHVDMDTGEISDRFGGNLTVEDALANGIAAIRETFEEAGVFLGFHGDRAKKELRRLCEMRRAGHLTKGWLREYVMAGKWVLRLSELARWSHWITPKERSKRFDTRFFVAFMPEYQECTPDNREITHGIWINPERGLEDNLRGNIPLSPPTVVTLNELLNYPNLNDLRNDVKTRAWGRVREPRFIVLSRGALILLPWDPMYNQEGEIDTEEPKTTFLPPGVPFSRILYHEGLWRPVGN